MEEKSSNKRLTCEWGQYTMQAAVAYKHCDNPIEGLRYAIRPVRGTYLVFCVEHQMAFDKLQRPNG